MNIYLYLYSYKCENVFAYIGMYIDVFDWILIALPAVSSCIGRHLYTCINVYIHVCIYIYICLHIYEYI